MNPVTLDSLRVALADASTNIQRINRIVDQTHDNTKREIHGWNLLWPPLIDMIGGLPREPSIP